MIPKSVFEETMQRLDIVNIASATIRQIVSLASALEEYLGERFVHLEMGNPGLPPSQVGIEAEKRALDAGCAQNYPNIAGIPELKKAGHEFLRAFLDIDIPARCIVPTVGSMQGTFTMFLLMGQRLAGKDTILFLDPGFPAQHNQVKLLGYQARSLDIHDCRGEALEDALEELLADGRVTAIVYSNPNNPAWTNLTETELQILARMAEKYDVIIMEDLAYMGMDFRRRFGIPYCEPFIPTVAKYTDRFVLFVSGSKIFSYAGQRIAMVCMSPAVADRRYEFFEKFYEMPTFGDAYIYGVLYCASSGVAHSVQHAYAAMLRGAVEGKIDFVENCRDYGHRAHRAKELFFDNGFHLVYAHDGAFNSHAISDGFFFTVGYPGMRGDELQSELLRYGIATISLPSTGSRQQGLRVCVSMLSDDDTFRLLEKRLRAFRADHPVVSGQAQECVAESVEP